MQRKTLRAAAIGAALLALVSVAAVADEKDYEFQLVDKEVKQGDAVIFAKRIDMGPDGMAMMDSPIELVASTEPGVYRFKTKLTMAGKWALSLGAKVQGETGTVENKLIVTATE